MKTLLYIPNQSLFQYHLAVCHAALSLSAGLGLCVRRAWSLHMHMHMQRWGGGDKSAPRTVQRECSGLREQYRRHLTSVTDVAPDQTIIIHYTVEDNVSCAII